MTEIVTRSELRDGLRALGLSSGSKVMVHSALCSFGYLEGGAQTLIEVLQDAVGVDGLIVMATFTYGREPYHPRITPAQTGRVPEVFRQMPAVLRSMHPTHSVAAWGRRAAWLVAGHDVEAPFGPGTPLHRLVEAGGHVLLIGVTHVANSMIHVAQELAQVPYLDRPKQVWVIDPNGEQRRVMARRAGCSLGFDKISPALERVGVVCHARIGASALQFMRAADVVAVTASILRRDPAALFCDRLDCFACNEARAMIAASQQVQSG